MKYKIKKILIANRGEIAMRIIRSAKELGISTVAVYSDADKHAPHVTYADQAVCIGPPPSSSSYLSIENLLEACKKTGVDAIHPGYGFLSESASFARQVQDKGYIFIGPTPDAIEKMGDKISSKQLAGTFSVPLVPGMDEVIDDLQKAKNIARKIGYPVMIKASAGGGGKGMRIVESEGEFESQMERAASEAKSSFGDGSLFIEKFISSPKHIEVQILGDNYGNYVHLFERECSIQRRNQKIIEEAPSAMLSKEQRKYIGNTAINVAKSCDYRGAGTVEFIADQELNFYFLEMNTRLQVEHPVTEMITGVDLVKEQIRIAMGNKLSFKQSDLRIKGHSIESRVYAENPNENFLPDIGMLKRYVRPQGPGIRVDDGYVEGMDISIYYDPMIGKLITYGSDRDEAIARMNRAIDEFKISGIHTTLPFCKFAINHPEFRDGSFNTKFVEDHFTPDLLKSELTEEERLITSIATFYLVKGKSRKRLSLNDHNSNWKNRK